VSLETRIRSSHRARRRCRSSRSNEFAAAAVHLRIAAGTVPDIEVEALLLQLRRTDPLGFVNTLASWNGEHKLPFSATMAVDANPRVRGQAAFSLIEHAHRFPADGNRAMAVLRTALTLDQGCCMADGVAQGVSDFPSKAFERLTADLRKHPSALDDRFQGLLPVWLML